MALQCRRPRPAERRQAPTALLSIHGDDAGADPGVRLVVFVHGVGVLPSPELDRSRGASRQLLLASSSAPRLASCARA